MIIGAIDGPIEVQRRDELAEEAFIDVTVRPATGIEGTVIPLAINISYIYPHGSDTPPHRRQMDSEGLTGRNERKS